MSRWRHTWKPWPRNPMEKLYPHYFNFHFTNYPTPKYVKGCYLCYKVEKFPHDSPTLLESGVFENQFYPRKRVHAELCFLKWFKKQKAFSEQNLGPDEIYRVTWYMSWSPCWECAARVLEFLSRHGYLKLRIFTPRLYHSDKAEDQQGLCNLAKKVQLTIMSLQDFEYCWETFVDHKTKPFKPWDNLKENSQLLSTRLEHILQQGLSHRPSCHLHFPFPFAVTGVPPPRGACLLPEGALPGGRAQEGEKGPSEQKGSARSWRQTPRKRHTRQEDDIMEPWPRLLPGTYNFHFPNLLNAPGRNSTYLCFEVEKIQGNDAESCHMGVFQNQDSVHAELCFLNWFRVQNLSPRVDYQVTWYLSWSPCFYCAMKVVKFLRKHKKVRLNIFASRLYMYDHREQHGLRNLEQAGAQVAMMSPELFEYCWDNFVYHGGNNFRYWKGVRRNYNTLVEELDEILDR
ncbi:DNA dC-_dU-editing enzyme APOBEC3-like [Pteronotus mesoamericanus]|uniref:DNA dC->dU-editing enzyme APOBEC3-like n=1 Tax=Pteronotus mesoamericanus TaxID=1884717 RepID=UPI0023EB20A4|nr:DNA dC->dU-editing enzyme APOBEC3-like [Pteronotus parnellii mesoamericanus]